MPLFTSVIDRRDPSGKFAAAPLASLRTGSQASRASRRSKQQPPRVLILRPRAPRLPPSPRAAGEREPTNRHKKVGAEAPLAATGTYVDSEAAISVMCTGEILLA